MNKGNAIAIGLMSLAIIALAIWNVQLSSRIESPSIESASNGGSNDRSGALDQQELSTLRERVAQVEKKATGLKNDFERYRESTDGAIAKLADGERPAVDAGGVAAAAPSDLERQVEAILEEREERNRQEQREQRAVRMAGFLMRGVEATPEQQKKVGMILMDYWDARRKSDSELRGRGATPEEIQASHDALGADRDLKLQQTLDSAQYAKVSETISNFGRWNRDGGGPRRGGGRRGGNGGGR